MIIQLIQRIARALNRGDATTAERAELQQAVQGLSAADQLSPEAHALLRNLETREQ